ncbi:type VI secretion system-associated protein TagF [Chromohalobacter sarecensis]|uniref:Type VI secretion system-associated protein TagF n=1 Tax=Chromohalobacter sarecensis TaxID=245294 RepID=A0ABV9D313_9GAMM|nr:type VI secretion system-associated protein TagF [Chromohalobacter sarecensis]MCK0714558.1 type VI secretion system-associated protein TagF [Chromohalobacter sarecensis]
MIGCFGKIPTKSDFVGLNAAGSVVQELDQWLQKALLQFLDHEDWKQRFDALPVCFFNYHARDGSDVMGAMISSMDASERRYPFFIFQLLKSGGRTSILPCLHTLGEIFAGPARDILTNSVHGKAPIDPVAAIQELRSWNEYDVALYKQVNERFLQDYSFEDIVKSLQWGWPEFIGSACLHRLYYARACWKAGSSLAVLLPLPAESGLKRPVADLWQQWLGSASPGGAPAMSLLIDDFMRPRLLLMPAWESAEQFFEVLSTPSDRRICIDVMAPFDDDEPHPGILSLPNTWLSLADFMACFPSQDASQTGKPEQAL